MKKVLTLVFAFMMCFLSNALLASGLTASAGYYSDNTFNGVVDHAPYRETLSYDSYSRVGYSLQRPVPSYSNSNLTNGCAPIAGSIIVGYYDYVSPDLMPNFVCGRWLGTVRFKYNYEDPAIPTCQNSLYSLMGTNTINNGTSLAQFKAGLTAYARNNGNYSVNYTSYGSNMSLASMQAAMEAQIPVVLFLDSYVYYDEFGFFVEDDNYIMSGYSAKVGHMVVAYAFAEYNFYKDGALIKTKKLAAVAMGDGDNVYIDLDNSLTSYSDAMAISIA